jgi:hypothetical protein
VPERRTRWHALSQRVWTFGVERNARRDAAHHLVCRLSSCARRDAAHHLVCRLSSCARRDAAHHLVCRLSSCARRDAAHHLVCRLSSCARRDAAHHLVCRLSSCARRDAAHHLVCRLSSCARRDAAHHLGFTPGSVPAAERLTAAAEVRTSRRVRRCDLLPRGVRRERRRTRGRLPVRARCRAPWW